jgi:hypothetical protein
MTGCTPETSDELVSVNGTVKNVLLVAEESWSGDSSNLRYLVLTLSNGEKYRLTPEQGRGLGKGFDVELKLIKNTKPNYKGEYEVRSAKISFIPIPGKNEKLKYPPNDTPEIIEESES